MCTTRYQVVVYPLTIDVGQCMLGDRQTWGDTVEFGVTPSIFSRLSNDIAIHSQYIQHNVSGYVFHTIDVDKYVLDKRGARVTPSNFE